MMLHTDIDWLRGGEEFVVCESPREEPGYWAGAPAVTYDEASGTTYLYYRLRKPRGQGRGYEARIAASHDGKIFEDIWSVTQQELDNSPSIERGSLVYRDGQWHLYLSYVSSQTQRWQIDRISATSVDALCIANRVRELDTGNVPAHAVKDPVVFSLGVMTFMFVSYAPLELIEAQSDVDLHASSDVFTTGFVKSHTGLAVSVGGEPHSWVGEVLGASAMGWDSLVSRISGIIPWHGVYLAFFDGAASVAENYEERVGLAVSGDLRTFYKLPSSTPRMQSQFGSLRYVSPVITPEGLYVYYEAAKENGSHALYGRKVGSI